MTWKQLTRAVKRLSRQATWHLLLAAAGVSTDRCGAWCSRPIRSGLPRNGPLLVGIDEYDDSANFPSLGGLAGADMRDLAAQLIQVGLSRRTRSSRRMTKLTKKKFFPFKKQIEKQLQLLLDPGQGLVGAGDLVIFGFSGHGSIESAAKGLSLPQRIRISTIPRAP